MDKSTILSGFNNHLFEFIEDIQKVFPENEDIDVTKTALSSFRKANPKLIITIWFEYIVDPYTSEIDKGNLDFFINKDYSRDVSDMNKMYKISKILESIDKLREPIKKMSDKNKKQSMQYMQNLSKLAKIYSN